MKKVAIVIVSILIYLTLKYSAGEQNIDHPNKEYLNNRLTAKLALMDFVDEALWDQTQKAKRKIPMKYREDFRLLMRTCMTEEDATKEMETFIQKVFPGTSDAENYEWVFLLKGDEDFTNGCKLLLQEIAELETELQEVKK